MLNPRSSRRLLPQHFLLPPAYRALAILWVATLALAMLAGCSLFAVKEAPKEEQYRSNVSRLTHFARVSTTNYATNFYWLDSTGERSLRSLPKSKTILVFWRTSDTASVQQIQGLRRLSPDANILGVALSEGGSGLSVLNRVAQFVAANDITIPIVIGNNDLAASFDGIDNYPTTFLLDAATKIQKRYNGYRDPVNIIRALSDFE